MDVFACLLKHVRNVAVFAAALVVLSAFVDASPETRLGTDEAKEGVVSVDGGANPGDGEPVPSVATAAGPGARD